MRRFHAHRLKGIRIASLVILLAAFVSGLVNNSLRAFATGQEAFCIDPSHGQGRLVR
jgi:hypothetical protein